MEQGNHARAGVYWFTLPFRPGFADWFQQWLLSYLSNPWILLLCAIFLYMLYQRYVKPALLDPAGEAYQAWQERRQVDADVAAQKKNPDLYRARMEAMALARERQQVRLCADG